MSDLLKRLRWQGPIGFDPYLQAKLSARAYWPELHEAADRLEALQAEKERLREALKTIEATDRGQSGRLAMAALAFDDSISSGDDTRTGDGP